MIGDFKVNNEIIKKNIFDLKPHQKNTQIYGINEDVSDIKASILSDGFITQLTISDNNTIISRHRRWKALTELVNEGHSEFTTVDCIVKHYETAEDELKAVIIANSTRNKNLEQIGREAIILKEIHSLEAEKRMKAGKKSDPMADLPKGSTRDLIAKELHSTGNGWITPKNVDVLLQSINKLDELEKNGDSLNADVLRHELHKDKHNFTAISKLTKNIDNISAENKQKLLDNEITVNDAVKAIENVSETVSEAIPIAKTPDELLKVINAFRKLPEYNNSTIKSIFDEIAYNVMSIEKVNNVLNGNFIEKIQPILNLDLWKKLNYFSDKNVDIIKFTIIKTLAIMVNADCWQKQDEHENYDYAYDIELSLIDFANNFLASEHNYHFEKLTDFFMQFNDYISKDKICSELQNFLDDCNLPHAVLVTNDYFYSLLNYGIDSNDLPFIDILYKFAVSKDDYDYIDDEYSEDLGYDRRFADTYVKERQESIEDFFLRYIDDYYTEISEEEEEEDDNE